MTSAQSKRVHRVNVNFSEGAYRDLAALAERKGKTMAEVLRDAIALLRWFSEQEAVGAHVLVEMPNGRVKEVILR